MVELSTLRRRAVRDRLRPQLLPRRRAVRLGLSDAGVSRLRAPPRRVRDRHHHAGHRRRATDRRPDRGRAGEPMRPAPAVGCRVRPVRARAWLQRLPEPRPPISTRCSGRRSLRGIAIMFCLLPPTRLALGALTAAQVPDASGLFNLMRNLGGAIGIALIDTILYGRTAGPRRGAARPADRRRRHGGAGDRARRRNCSPTALPA